MAHISKQQVQEKRKLIAQLCKVYGVTATVSGSNSSKITITIRKGVIDFLVNHVETVKRDFTNSDNNIASAQWHAKHGFFVVNQYYIDRQFSGIVLDFMNKLLSIIKSDHYYNSDAVSDYFDHAFYISIKIGEWNKPYLLVKD